MGNIVVSENMSLDGVVQDPTGEEGFKFGGWFDQVSETDRAEFATVKTAEAMSAAALLLGGRSYEWFAQRWATRPGAWADRLRSLPKYVMSSTAEPDAWGGAKILTGDLVDEVAKLKVEVAGDIVVYGSGRLVHTLLEQGLVDELRLLVFPVALGSGDRLFGETSEQTSLHLIDSGRVGEGLAQLTYRR